MTNSKYDAEFRITERDRLKVQLDIYSLKRRGAEYSVSFEVKWTEVICNIHTKQIETMMHFKTSKEEQEWFFLSWAKVERQLFSDILCQFSTLSNIFDVDQHFIVNINHDYGTGAATVCKIRGGQIVSHLFLGEFD